MPRGHRGAGLLLGIPNDVAWLSCAETGKKAAQLAKNKVTAGFRIRARLHILSSLHQLAGRAAYRAMEKNCQRAIC